jgi:hypothetical protein
VQKLRVRTRACVRTCALGALARVRVRACARLAMTVRVPPSKDPCVHAYGTHTHTHTHKHTQTHTHRTCSRRHLRGNKGARSGLHFPCCGLHPSALGCRSSAGYRGAGGCWGLFFHSPGVSREARTGIESVSSETGESHCLCVCVCVCVRARASESDAEMLGATVSSKFHILLVPLVYFTTIIIVTWCISPTYFA